MTFAVEEVEQAFQKYWTLGAVGEDWDAWVDQCFTPDVTYVEHILGNRNGREEVRAWIKPTMEEYGEIYTAYEWHMIDDRGRVVVYMQNRRDNPEPGAPPIDFAGMTVLQYAGDGKFSLEEDFWSLTEGVRTQKEYDAACAAHDPDHKRKRTRLNWGKGPAWARGADSYAGSLGARRAERVTAMPEMPQMQALSERLDAWLNGARLTGYEPLGFTGLKTFAPPPEAVVGKAVRHVGRRGKYVVFEFENDLRLLVHLSQAGRLDMESPPKKTKPKGSVVRLRFDDDKAMLVREFGTERKAGWWLLEPGDNGPMTTLGPEANSDEFAQFIRTSTDGRRIHTLLRDQHTVTGVGRGYSDDILHHAHLSPYATLKSLSAEQRETLLDAIHAVLDDGLARERKREGGLSANKLGEHFVVHGKAGVPCPVCGNDLQRVSYESHEVVYCPHCQTGGKVLADRRLSRLVK